MSGVCSRASGRDPSNLQDSQFFSLIDGNLPRGDRFDPHCIHSHAVRSLGASSGLQKPATQPGVQPCPRCPIPPSPSTTADIKLRPTKNSAKQLTNAEWLASFPATDTQKKALLNCIS